MIQKQKDLKVDIKKDKDLILIALAIGSLASSSLMSIRSLLSISPTNKICMGTNRASAKSLKSSLTSEEFEKLCLHDLTDSFTNTINIDINNLDGYHTYHSNGFSNVTLGKWLLTLDVFKSHDSQYVLYSDIDIFWKPSSETKITVSPNVYILTQDGWHPSKGDWYCTGIMFWVNNNITKELLSGIIEAHVYGLKTNNSINDEVLFNSLYLNSKELNKHISVLPQYEYLVGYHILNFRWLHSSRLIRNCVAFHANSVEGEDLKRRMLEIAQPTSRFWIHFLLRMFLISYRIQKRNMKRKFRLKT